MSTDYSADVAAGGPPPGTAQPPAKTILQSHEGEHHGDFGDTEIPLTKSVMTFAFCAAMNSTNLGYDIGVSTTAGKLLQEQWDLTDEQREVFVGMLNLTSIFGALSSHWISDRYGRRTTFVIAAVGFIVGLLVQTIAPNYTCLLVGRALVGLGCGVGLAIDPVYISEISPARYRGELVTWSEIGINIGIVLGFAMGVILSFLDDNVEWRAMFLMGTIMPCAMIYLALKVMIETPRWYVLKYRYEDAKRALYDIYPPGYNVEPIMDDIKEALERERLAEQTLGWHTIFCPTPAFRRMLVVGVGIAVAQQLVGIDAVQYYLLDIMEATTASRVAQNMLLIVLGCIKLGCIFVAGKFFDYRGRRPLVYLSLVGMTASLLAISLVFYIAGSDNPSTVFTVLGLGLYLAFFSFGMGPAAWLIPSEVFATCIRAKAMSVATMMNRITATIMSSTFLSMRNGLGWAGFFILLAMICVLILFFLYFVLPETKGHSLEDMSLYFAEITGDNSVLDAERKIRVEQELQGVNISPPAVDGTSDAPAAGGTMT